MFPRIFPVESLVHARSGVGESFGENKTHKTRLSCGSPSRKAARSRVCHSPSRSPLSRSLSSCRYVTGVLLVLLFLLLLPLLLFLFLSYFFFVTVFILAAIICGVWSCLIRDCRPQPEGDDVI